MKYAAIILALLCISLPAFSQLQSLPILQTLYVRGENGDNLVPSSQQSFQYGKDGRLRIYKNYTWFANENRWVRDHSIESDYDDFGNLSHQKSTYWHELTDTIDRRSTITQIFDTQNRLIEYSISDEVPRNDYKSTTRFIYSYDQNGCNNEIRLQSSYNGSSAERVIVQIMDEQCRLAIVRSYPTVVTEGPHEATVYAFENDREVSRHVYYVDQDTTLAEEHLFEYDQSGRLVFNQRTNVERFTYEYDDAGNLIRQLHNKWNSETMSWMLSSEYLQTFDGDHNLLSRESFFSPTSTDSWFYSQFDSYEYNNAGKPLRIHYRSVYNFGQAIEYKSVKEFSYRCDGLEKETISTVTQGDNPGLATKTITVYNDHASCDNSENSPIVIFPNPTSDFVRLLLPAAYDTVAIHIISSTGQLADVITTDEAINPVDLDVSGLADGAYIVQVMSEGFVATGRIVKK